jgi:hypothetical protein
LAPPTTKTLLVVPITSLICGIPELAPDQVIVKFPVVLGDGEAVNIAAIADEVANNNMKLKKMVRRVKGVELISIKYP